MSNDADAVAKRVREPARTKKEAAAHAARAYCDAILAFERQHGLVRLPESETWTGSLYANATPAQEREMVALARAAAERTAVVKPAV